MKLIPGYFWCCLIFLLFLSTKSEKYKNTRYEKIFEENLIVPHLLPSNPEELCTVIYEPNLIIATGQPYYMYQVQSIPEIIWDFSVEKYYTLVMLGAIQKEIRYPSTTVSVLKNNTDDTRSPPEQFWHHWVIVNVRKNNLDSGTIIQPFNVNCNVQPNSTHKLVYTFAVFEQSKKLDIQVDDKDNTSKTLLERYFTPLSKYVQNFNESTLIGGNFFYATVKPEGLVLDSSPIRYLDKKW